MNYNAEINYTIDIKKHGGTWQPLQGWTRPFFEQDKLDETLDNGNVSLNAKRLQKLPPCTIIRLQMQIVVGEITKNKTSYFASGNEPIMKRTFVD
ncbi:MAG: hypothetical protein RR348_04210 [Clostridia bacterium]